MSTACEPRSATPRTRRRTLGPQVAGAAKRIGLDLLPWQRLVLSVALEQARGRPAYRDVLVSVPRQSGKSTLLLALIAWQMTERPGSRILYGAQTRVAARQKMLSGWWPRLASSPLGGDLKLFRGFGNETIEHPNGSVLQLLSAAESAGIRNRVRKVESGTIPSERLCGSAVVADKRLVRLRPAEMSVVCATTANQRCPPRLRGAGN